MPPNSGSGEASRFRPPIVYAQSQRERMPFCACGMRSEDMARAARRAEHPLFLPTLFCARMDRRVRGVEFGTQDFRSGETERLDLCVQNRSRLHSDARRCRQTSSAPPIRGSCAVGSPFPSVFDAGPRPGRRSRIDPDSSRIRRFARGNIDVAARLGRPSLDRAGAGQRLQQRGAITNSRRAQPSVDETSRWPGGRIRSAAQRMHGGAGVGSTAASWTTNGETHRMHRLGISHRHPARWHGRSLNVLVERPLASRPSPHLQTHALDGIDRRDAAWTTGEPTRREKAAARPRAPFDPQGALPRAFRGECVAPAFSIGRGPHGP